MKTNELSDKELSYIFQKQKRSYQDDFFKIQIMRKINMFNHNPFKRIMVLCSGFYLIYFVLLFFPSVRIFVIEKMQMASTYVFQSSFKVTDSYLVYVFLMLLLIIELFRIIRDNYKSL